MIAENLGFYLFEEQFAENIFLPLFYTEPKRWAFHSQLFFLHEKAAQLAKIKELLKSTDVVQGCPIEQDYRSYAKAQKILGYISPKEFLLYEQFYDSLNKNLPQPDLIIQLDASLTALVSRITGRDRSYERNIDVDYLQTLITLQDDWLVKHPKKVLRINTDELDLSQNKEQQKKFINLVKERLIG